MALRRCGPHPAFAAPISSGGGVEAEGLYAAAPPPLAGAGRQFDCHAAILAELQLLVQDWPQLAPLPISSKQERYFKNQQLGQRNKTQTQASAARPCSGGKELR